MTPQNRDGSLSVKNYASANILLENINEENDSVSFGSIGVDTTNHPASASHKNHPQFRIMSAHERQPNATPTLNKMKSVSHSNTSLTTSSKLVRSQVGFFKHRGKLVCQMCFGPFCAAENWRRNKSPYIQGLHSNLISNVLVASSRPSTRRIEKYKIIE